MASSRERVSEIHLNASIDMKAKVNSHTEGEIARTPAYGIKLWKNSFGSKIKMIMICMSVLASRVSTSYKLGALCTILSVIFERQETMIQRAKSVGINLILVTVPEIDIKGAMTSIPTVVDPSSGRNIPDLKSIKDPFERVIVGAYCEYYTDIFTAGVFGTPEISMATITNLLIQVAFGLAKSLTSAANGAAQIKKLYGERVDRGRADRACILSNSVCDGIGDLFHNCVEARKIMVDILIYCADAGLSGTAVISELGRIKVMIEGTGMTALNICLEVIMIRELVELDQGLYQSDIVRVGEAVNLIKKHGGNAPMLFLTGHSDMARIYGSRFKQLFSFALGFKRVTSPTFANYSASANSIDQAAYEQGQDAGRRMTATKEDKI